MADRTWLEESFSAPFNSDPYRDGSSFLDYPKAFGARAAGMVGDLGSVVRSIGESREDPDYKAGQAAEYLGKFTQNLFNGLEDYTIDSLSETSKRDLQSTFTDPNFWSLNSMALKASNMAPDIVAAAIPSAIVPGVGTAIGMAALQGGVFNAASVVDDIYRRTDALSDAELQEQAKLYRDLRAQGMDEQTARSEYNRVFMGMRPLIVGAIGAITNVAGPAGQAARVMGGGAGSLLSEAGEGVLKRSGKGFLEGAVSEGIQEGSQEYYTQEGAVEGGLQNDVDLGAVAEAAGTGAVLGGLFGGGVSAASGRSGKAGEPVAIPDGSGESTAQGTNSTTPPEMGHDQSASGATTEPGAGTSVSEVPPVAAAETGTPVAEAVPASPEVTIVEPSAPDPAQTEALVTSQPAQPRPVETVTNDPVTGPVASSEATVTTQGNPVVTEAIPETPSVETPAPVVETTPPVEAVERPPVTQPAPIEVAPVEPAIVRPPTEPVVTPDGRRILTDLTQPDQVQVTNDQARYNVERAERTPEQIETLEKEGETGRKFSKAERDQRKAVRDGALVLTEKHKPTDIEKNIFSSKKAISYTARKHIMDRAKAIVADADKMGLKIPAAFRDTAEEGERYNPETLILIEAKNLARKGDAASRADYERFVSRELDVRSGAFEEAVAERRAEGDAANKQGGGEGDLDIGDMADTDRGMASGGMNPEEALIAAEETAEETGIQRGKDNPEPKAKAPVKEVQEGVDYTVPKADRKAPVVATTKKREKVAGGPKIADLKERLGKKKEEAKPTKEVDPHEPVGAREDRRGHYSSIAKSLEDGLKTWPDGNEMLEGKMKLAKRLASMSDEDYAKVRKGLHRDMEPGVTMEPEKGMAVIDEVLGKEVTTEGNPEKKPSVLQAIKERVAKAREATNTNPTQRQAETGNYAKGRVSIHGIPMAIENPKGSTRTNKDPNGPKWKVKMPADYGYIEGTKGADGDPIDVYIGPDHDAEYYYVIDQLDAETREFDEHKVLAGFKSPTQAIRAYDRAFSDGLGMVRAGDMRKMTLAEFKAWLDTDPQERAGISRDQANEALVSMLIDVDEANAIIDTTARTGVTPEGYFIDPLSKKVAKPLATRTVADMLVDIDLSNLRGAERVIAGTARAQLMKLAGDVPVHILERDDIARLSNVADANAPYGYHIAQKDGKDVIVIRADLLKNPDKMRHTILHEATHSATVRAIVSDRNLQREIKAVADLVYFHAVQNMTDADMQILRYGFTNVKEFVAETFSNPEFQRVLSNIPANDDVVRYFKLDRSKVRSLWDALVHSIRRALKLPTNSYTMLEAAMRVTEEAIRPRTADVDAMAMLSKPFLEDGEMSALTENMKESLDNLKKRREFAPTEGNPALLGFRTFDSIARAADRYFKGNNVVRKIADVVEGQRVAAVKEFDRAAPTIQKLHELSKKYKGQVWQDFTALVHDETMAGVYADRPLSDQKHLTKGDTWQKAQHADLAKRFNALPADLKAARSEAMSYFKAEQNALALSVIRNRIVSMFDTPDPDGLAQRIFEKSATDADKELLGDVYDTIAAAGVLSKIDGPYFPLMRRGNFVVKGKYKVTTPGNATKLADNEFEFTDKQAALDYMAKQQGRPTMRTVYVDKTTGKTTGTENGKTVRITAQDINAEPRYRVVVQDRHMEMFDTMKEARNRVAELRAAGIDTDDAVPRAFEGYGVQTDALSIQMRRMFATMEKRADARGMTSEQKHELMAALNEMSMSLLGSTRIQSRSLPRTYVAGASKDLVRNITDYAHAAGNYKAKLDWRPKLDAAMKDMADQIKNGKNDGLQAGRVAIQNEVMRRVTSPNPAVENKLWNGVSSRILSLSFVDKLMSPTYSLINAAQPMMTTAPYLAGQYGPGKAYAAMTKAYNDVGSLATIKRGFLDTVSKMKPGNTIIPTDPVSIIRGRLTNKGEQALIDILVERGVVDTDSGFEVHKLVQDGKGLVGKLDSGIGYLEGIAHQMPKTVEAINRTVSALAAYRLEMARSGNQARAIQFAQDTVNLTQFNYSASNAAPFMNHPVLRLALQFKKYGLSMYQLLGEQVALAIRNENAGDRARALKSLSYTIGMHVLVAGAMGLPTEPIKMIVTAANGLGVIDWNWQDVENGQREALAGLFGKDFGEIASRGLPRALGVDLSSRMGIDTLMGPFGEPRSNEAQDWKAYLWDTLAGAPAGLMADWAKGVNDLAQGDLIRAAERLVPVKAFSDSVKAYRTFTEGTVSERTGKQTMTPYSLGEAAIRAFGFAPSREAEGYERQAAFYRAKGVQDEQRSQFQREWVEANGAARGRLWREITRWNKGQPAEARLTISELRGYQKRMERDMKETKDGIRARRREQHILDRADDTYNF